MFLSWCCQSECYDEGDRWTCKACGASKLKTGEDIVITRETQWRTQIGTRIRICDMTDSHLLRTIRVLRSMSPIGTKFNTTPERRRAWLNAMANEAYERGLHIDEITEQELAHGLGDGGAHE